MRVTSRLGKSPNFQFRTVSLEEILGAVRISMGDDGRSGDDEGIAPVVIRVEGIEPHYRSRLLGITPKRNDATKLGITLEVERPPSTEPITIEPSRTCAIGLFFSKKPYFVMAKFKPELSHAYAMSFEAELPFYDLQRRASARIEASDLEEGEASLKIGIPPYSPEPAQLIDLSLGGLCFKVSQEAEATLLRQNKQTLHVELTVKDVTFKTFAKIRYVRRMSSVKVAFKVGLQFESLSAHASAKLNSFLFEDGLRQLERKSSQTSRRR